MERFKCVSMNSDATPLEERLSKSKAMRQFLPLSAEEWAGILADLDEEEIHGFALIADEEDSMRDLSEKKATRRKKAEKIRHGKVLERLKMKAEVLSDNQQQ